MKEKAAHRFHGRRGGGFVADDHPALRHLPQPVPVTCGCAVVARWWVTPADVGRPCFGCGQPLTVEEGIAA